VVTDASGRLVWRDGVLKSGDYVDLRTEMDIIVALSNCPHPLSPANTAEPVRATLWRAPTANNDACRAASEEAMRAFQNTDALFQD
jgi:uncharacterized protein YcgI (DUF1989 family)